MILTKEERTLLRDGWADIACWHYGFAAARPDYQGPPQLRELSDLMSKLKRRAQEKSQ